MTHSQSIARIFAIVGYILIVPASMIIIIILIQAGIFLGEVTSGQTFSWEKLLLGFVPLIFYAWGVTLLVGYHKHKNGKLGRDKIIPLWIATLVFDVLLMSPFVYLAFSVELISTPLGDINRSVRMPLPPERSVLTLGDKGIGQKLLDECFRFTRNSDCNVMWLGVWEHNPRAIRFYEKNGFYVVGSHIFQLGSDPQTDLLMQRKL